MAGTGRKQGMLLADRLARRAPSQGRPTGGHYTAQALRGGTPAAGLATILRCTMAPGGMAPDAVSPGMATDDLMLLATGGYPKPPILPQ